MTDKFTMACEALYDDKKNHRFSWTRIWNKNKPTACVITINPGSDSIYELDLTSMLIMNNVYRLGNFGGVCVVNLFSKISSRLKKDDFEDDETILKKNITQILNSASKSNCIILAWGKSGETNKYIAEREKQVLSAIQPYTDKMFVISNKYGESGLHPLSPSIRKGWNLIPYVNERQK